MGKWLTFTGAALLFIGIAMTYLPGLVNWFGRLPGDIRFELGNTKVFFPLTSMIVLSIILTLLVGLFKR